MKDRSVAGFDATSTLHDFRGWTKSVGGSVTFEKDRLEETAAAKFVVDARTLDTGNPDRDAEMHRDFLESAKHPEFVFTLSEFRRASPGATSGRCTMKGTLEIHGTRKDVEASGTFELRRGGHLHVKGELLVKMTDFGISPPVTALIIRVGDEIKIWFEVWAEPAKEEKP
jgi:polyisoprenoid-binding protein YceI